MEWGRRASASMHKRNISRGDITHHRWKRRRARCRGSRSASRGARRISDDALPRRSKPPDDFRHDFIEPLLLEFAYRCLPSHGESRKSDNRCRRARSIDAPPIVDTGDMAAFHFGTVITENNILAPGITAMRRRRRRVSRHNAVDDETLRLSIAIY